MGNPYKTRMTFVIIPMDPKFEVVAQNAQVNFPELTMAPGFSRQVIVTFRIPAPQKERTIGVCVQPKNLDSTVLPRVCGTYTGKLSALAADGILLPSPPVGAGRRGCHHHLGRGALQPVDQLVGRYLDFGVAGGDLDSYTYPSQNAGGQSAIGYARIIVPLGAAPKRLDCSRLYDLEIARLKAEIQMLKVGLQ